MFRIKIQINDFTIARRMPQETERQIIYNIFIDFIVKITYVWDGKTIILQTFAMTFNKCILCEL